MFEKEINYFKKEIENRDHVKYFFELEAKDLYLLNIYPDWVNPFKRNKESMNRASLVIDFRNNKVIKNRYSNFVIVDPNELDILNSYKKEIEEIRRIKSSGIINRIKKYFLLVFSKK